MSGWLETLWSNLSPSAGVLLLIILALVGVQRLPGVARPRGDGSRYRLQLITAGIWILGTLAFVLALPLSDELTGQLLSLLGILLSAAIALSSTTVLGNAMAGFMLRVTQGFRIGDFIHVGEHFGRVTEWGIFHVEIQTERRELTTFPNLYLVQHPFTTVRSSGTVVTAQVSLGYDVPRSRIESLLKEAAAAAGLEDPFVHVLELGDFSVTYRVAGLLPEVKELITTRSRLRASVMDALHGGGVEIVSPTFVYRRSADEHVFIPEQEATPEEKAWKENEERRAEDVVFDKAEEAESREERIRLLTERLAEVVEELKGGPEAGRARELKRVRDRIRERLEALTQPDPE